MRKEFVIDNVYYVFNYDGKNIVFYIDALKSPPNLFVDYNSMDFKFGDVPPDNHFRKINKPEVVFKIAKEAKKFIDDVIKKYDPAYFEFSANEPEKVAVYSKFANRISVKYNYHLFSEENRFFFYKKY